MRTLKEIEKILRAHKRELEERFGVREIGIFGSYVREKATEASDVDIDLVLKSALKPKIAECVSREVVYV